MGMNKAFQRFRGVVQRLMQKLKPIRKRPYSLMALGLALGLVMLTLSSLLSPKVLREFEHKILDLRFQTIRSSRNARTDVTIVLVERKYTDSQAREKYDELVKEYYEKKRVQAIGFDLVLYGADRNDETEWFSTGLEFSGELDEGSFPKGLRQAFEERGGVSFFPRVNVSVIDEGQKWEVEDDLTGVAFCIKKEEDKLNAYGINIRKTDIKDVPLRIRSQLAGMVYFAFAKSGASLPYSDEEHKKVVAALEEKSEWTCGMIRPKSKNLLCLATGDMIAPLPQFIKASKGIGHAHTTTLESDTLRKVPLLIRYENHVYPALCLQIACDVLGVKIDKQHIDVQLGKHIRLVPKEGEPIEIPIDKKACMYINYAGKFRDRYGAKSEHESNCSVFTLDEMLDPNPPEPYRVILVGAGMKRTIGEKSENQKSQKQQLVDAHRTPVDICPGVGIHASIIENILQNDFLHLKGKLNGSMLIILGLAVGFVGTSRSLFRSVWIALVLAAYLGIALLFFKMGFWIEMAVPLTVLPITMLGYVIYDVHRSDFAAAKQQIVARGFSMMIVMLLIISLVMVFFLGKSAYIGLVATLVGAIANIVGMKKVAERRTAESDKESKKGEDNAQTQE